MLITGGMLHLNIKLDRKSGLTYATYARNALAKNWEVGRQNLLYWRGLDPMPIASTHRTRSTMCSIRRSYDQRQQTPFLVKYIGWQEPEWNDAANMENTTALDDWEAYKQANGIVIQSSLNTPRPNEPPHAGRRPRRRQGGG